MLDSSATRRILWYVSKLRKLEQPEIEIKTAVADKIFAPQLYRQELKDTGIGLLVNLPPAKPGAYQLSASKALVNHEPPKAATVPISSGRTFHPRVLGYGCIL